MTRICTTTKSFLRPAVESVYSFILKLRMNKMLEDDEVEILIEEIGKRPVLYDNTLKDYFNNNIKNQLWDEVCLAIVTDWNEMKPLDRNGIGRAIKKKWQNLRSCFSRELRIQKSGNGALKRRRYLYFEKLLFLLPSMESRINETTVTSDYDAESETEHTETEIQRKPKLNVNRSTVQRKQNPCEEPVPELPKSRDTDDEDVHFVLSLVPTFKKFDENKKLEAKIQILTVLKNLNLESTP